jgi:hypothetical protein
MDKSFSTQQTDPVVARLLRTPSGLRADGYTSVDYEVLATYLHDGGERPFAFCRDGLIIEPDGSARYLAFHEIESASLHDHGLLKREKGGAMLTSLPLALKGGETLTLPLNARADGMSERLTIAGLIEQRIRIANSERRRAQASEAQPSDSRRPKMGGLPPIPTTVNE